MNVVKFPRAATAPGGWRAAELQRLLAVWAEPIAAGQASSWEVGATERGDPQIFLIGPPPDYSCVMSISRLGHLYVIEDGAGRVLYEHDNLMLLAEQAAAAFRNRKAAVFAYIAVAWFALRKAVEEKTEALMAEPMELLTQVAPPLAALA
jgi:hypothetical protein